MAFVRTSSSGSSGGLVPNAYPVCSPSAGGPPVHSPNPNISIQLDNADLWRKFHHNSTEMIVTKSGRRMFPTLRYKLTGLDPNATYTVCLELHPADQCRYKFQNGRWIVAGQAESVTPSNSRLRTYMHPDSPAPGRIWMRQPLSFHRIKLTNNVMDPQGHVLLNSMHKYQPQLHVIKLHDPPQLTAAAWPLPQPQFVASAAFPETQFIAVTAYQNDKVIQLKIDHNPFAKGFRDNGIQAQSASLERKRAIEDDDAHLRQVRACKQSCAAESTSHASIVKQSAFTSALLLASPCSSSSSGRSTSSASSSGNSSSPKSGSIWNPLHSCKSSSLEQTPSPVKPLNATALPDSTGLMLLPHPQLALANLLQHNYLTMLLGMAGANSAS